MKKLCNRGNKELISEHFKAIEFDCHCGKCLHTAIDSDLIERLEEMRLMTVNVPIIILSGFRCAERQQYLREKGFETARFLSMHELGRAADIMTRYHSGIDLERLARRAGFESVGVSDAWIHVDLRPGYRRWEYGTKNFQKFKT